VFRSPYTGPFKADDASALPVALTTSSDPGFNAGMVEPATMMNMGILAAQTPAPLMAIDEDDELFVTLTNVGQIMRPDLFEQHTVHFHGYPNASSYFDGVPDASVAINIAGSFTYYYTAPDAGTYFWHCHITPPEHLQMGMVGQLYVRPRQNRLTAADDLGAALKTANAKVAGGGDGSTCSDILCTGQTPAPASSTGARGGKKYAYNDGDGSTAYDVEMPLQMMGFDPNFHYVGMTFNPEAFADMKDKYFLLNGRGYPDTVNTDPVTTLGADGVSRVTQPMHSQIRVKQGQRALLRISMLSVTEHVSLATNGIPMLVIAQNARLLRDMAGNNLYYNTNSITMGGGESTDVIIDTAGVPAGTYYLYSTNLDHLSNDAENFGGMMTEIVVEAPATTVASN
jgi:FtsP/CotA-like multicopper oxidase with cupredoxin domain